MTIPSWPVSLSSPELSETGLLTKILKGSYAATCMWRLRKGSMAILILDHFITSHPSLSSGIRKSAR
jgi:hypothetical protein